MDVVNTILLPVIGVVLPLGIGFLLGKWQAVRAAALASPNKLDDAAVAAVEQLAQKIVDAKLEDPKKPLGEK